MPGTYTHLVEHVIFSTKRRECWIDSDLQPRLYDYIGGVVRGECGVLCAIGGMPDHVHLMIRWRPDSALSDLMRKVKANSSLWIHQGFGDKRAFAWQEGFSAFSVSRSVEPHVKAYIENQAEHHRRRDFKEELIAIYRAHGVEFDERYVFD